MIEVIRGSNPLKAEIIHRHKESEFDGCLDVYQILKLMPFIQKLNLVIKVLDNKLIRLLLLRAIISDLVEEQAHFRQDKNNGNVKKEELAKSLYFMQSLLQYDYSPILSSEEGCKFLKNVFTVYAYITKRLTKGREHFLFNRRGMMLTDICETAAKTWMKNNLSLSDAEIKIKLKKLRSDWSDKRSEEIRDILICNPGYKDKTTQNNWIQHQKVFAEKNLPKVTHNTSRIKSTFSFFLNDISREKAVKDAEATAKTLSFR